MEAVLVSNEQIESLEDRHGTLVELTRISDPNRWFVCGHCELKVILECGDE